jgi:hypothetical protein
VTADFDQLVDLTDLSPEERARLLRVHELLVAAGPPAELPSALARPPEQPDEAEVVPLPAQRRRPLATFLIAAAVAAACFGGGYVLANQAHQTSAIHVVRIVPLQGVGGQQNSFASLRVGSSDANGNWPIQLTVAGLPALQQKERYYLMVWQNGRPVAFCGTFEVADRGSTTVTFSVAYKITRSTRWVVTRMAPGVKPPGHVVMTTT